MHREIASDTPGKSLGVRDPGGRRSFAVWCFCLAFAAFVAPPPLSARQSAPAAPRVATPPQPIAFRGVTVVDVATGNLVADRTVVIAGTRIKAVGAASKVRLPRGTRVIDASGKYLIPGLWDMHVHTWNYPQVFFPLLIANGVTGAREMNTPYLDSLFRWRREIAAGARVGPRLLVTGGFLGLPSQNGVQMFDGPIPIIEAATPAAARRVVDSLKAAGVDFIKVRDGLPRAAYFAAVHEARRIGIPLVGHLSDSVTAVEASDSGQLTIEHALLHECATAESDGQCGAVAARLRRNGTWITPTLIYRRYFFGGVAPEHLQYWPDTVESGGSVFTGGGLPAGWQSVLAAYKRAGMPLLAGTDAAPSWPENLPGFSLHEELALFVEAGLTPLDALQAATLNPAKALGATDSLGTVAAGKLADLVLLDANPLADIGNAQKIQAVVANGRYFDRAALDALVAKTKRAAR